MKHLLLILALLITAPAITCRAQATFKQAFISMPLASESSLGLQPIGTPLARDEEILFGIILTAGGTLLSIWGPFEIAKDLRNPSAYMYGIGIITGAIMLGVGIPLLAIGIHLLTKK